MKKFVIGALFVGLASLGYSQNTNGEMEEVKLSDVVVTPLNLTYMQKVQDETTPRPVIKLENEAARYNLKASPVYDKNLDAYQVMFSQTNAHIIATYDGSGKIISASEKYKDLTLPFEVRNAIYKEHPGWIIHSDAYLVSYYQDKDVKKTYKAQIRKGNLKKNLKLDIDGNKM